MIASSKLTYKIDFTKILWEDEISAILRDLQRRSRRSVSYQLSLVLFRLATCCGLRVAEIAALQLRDIITTQKRPHVIVRNGKGGKFRRVPLWLDKATLADITAWKDFRLSQGAGPDDPFLANQRKGSVGQALAVRSLQSRFHTIVNKVLPPERGGQLSIHAGRHSFCTHLLRRGYDVRQVQEYAGHSSLSSTVCYLHLDPNEGEEVGSAFDFGERIDRNEVTG